MRSVAYVFIVETGAKSGNFFRNIIDLKLY